MIVANEQQVTEDALAVMARTEDPRLREILVALVRHLHAFARDVRLTEAEFRQAAAVVAELGQRTTDAHNEVVLMAGSLGLSSLVCLQNHCGASDAATSHSLLGPFWRMHSPAVRNGGSIVRSPTPGEKRCS